MVQLSFVLALPPSARGTEAAQALRRGARPQRAARRDDGGSAPRATLLRRLRPLARTRSTSRRSTSPRCAPRRSRATRSSSASTSGSAARSSSSARAPAATRTPSASTRSSTTRATPATRGSRATSGFDAYNLGAQVENETLAARAQGRSRADAILVSQVITQRNCHKENARALVELLERQGWRRDVILLCSAGRASITSWRSSSASTPASARAPSPATSPRTSSSGSAGRGRLATPPVPRSLTTGRCTAPSAGGAPAVLDHVLDVPVARPAVVARAARLGDGLHRLRPRVDCRPELLAP